MRYHRLPDKTYEDLNIAIEQASTLLVASPRYARADLEIVKMLLQADRTVLHVAASNMQGENFAKMLEKQTPYRLGKELSHRSLLGQTGKSDADYLVTVPGIALQRELQKENQQWAILVSDLQLWDENVEALLALLHDRRAEKNLQLIVCGDSDAIAQAATLLSAATTIIVPSDAAPHVTTHQLQNVESIDAAISYAEEGHKVLLFCEQAANVTAVTSDVQSRVSPLQVTVTSVSKLRKMALGLTAPSTAPGAIVIAASEDALLHYNGFDVVVDPGIGRGAKVYGTNSHKKTPLSQVDCRLRAEHASTGNRANIYALCSPLSIEKRDRFLPPSVLHSDLHRITLRLLSANVDPCSLTFVHAINEDVFDAAKRTLWRLGVLDDHYRVTPLGQEVNRLPLSVVHGSMVMHAVSMDCVEPVAIIAACMEAGGIRHRNRQWESIVKDTPAASSDLLAELYCFQYVEENDLHIGIVPANYRKAKRTLEKVRRALRTKYRRNAQAKDTSVVLDACTKGLANALWWSSGKQLHNSAGSARMATRNSTLPQSHVGFITGLPLSIDSDGKELNFVHLLSPLSPEKMEELLPHMIRPRIEPYHFNSKTGRVISRQRWEIDGFTLGSVESTAPLDGESAGILAELILAKRTGLSIEAEAARTIETLQELWVRSSYSSALDDALGTVRNQLIQQIQQLQLPEASLEALEGRRLGLDTRDFHLQSWKSQLRKIAPTTLNYGGEVFHVDYPVGAAPQLRLSTRQMARNSWQVLPANGVRLFDGRRVVITGRHKGSMITAATPSELERRLT